MNNNEGILVIKYENLQNRFHELFQKNAEIVEENEKLKKIIAKLQEENVRLIKTKQNLMNSLDKQR